MHICAAGGLDGDENCADHIQEDLIETLAKPGGGRRCRHKRCSESKSGSELRSSAGL